MHSLSNLVLLGDRTVIQMAEEASWDDNPIAMKFEPQKYARLGLSLADLEYQSRHNCEFAQYLRNWIRNRSSHMPKSAAVHLFARVEHRQLCFRYSAHLGTMHKGRVFEVEMDLTHCYTPIRVPCGSPAVLPCDLRFGNCDIPGHLAIIAKPNNPIFERLP